MVSCAVGVGRVAGPGGGAQRRPRSGTPAAGAARRRHRRRAGRGVRHRAARHAVHQRADPELPRQRRCHDAVHRSRAARPLHPDPREDEDPQHAEPRDARPARPRAPAFPLQCDAGASPGPGRGAGAVAAGEKEARRWPLAPLLRDARPRPAAAARLGELRVPPHGEGTERARGRPARGGVGPTRDPRPYRRRHAARKPRLRPSPLVPADAHLHGRPDAALRPRSPLDARRAGRLHARRPLGPRPAGSRRRLPSTCGRAWSGPDVQGGKGRHRGDLRRSRARVQLRGDATAPRRAWTEDREPRWRPFPLPRRTIVDRRTRHADAHRQDPPPRGALWHHRPWLRRPAPRDRVRAGRLPRHRDRRGPRQGRADHGRPLLRRRRGRRRDRRTGGGGAAGSDPGLRGDRRPRHGGHLRADPTPQDEGPGPHVRGLGRQRDPAVPSPGAAGHPGEHDLPGHDRGGRPAGARDLGAAGGPRLLPRLLARADRPGEPALQDAQHPEGRRGRHPGLHRCGCRALRRVRRSGCLGYLDPRLRYDQAPREHVPQRQHRAGERDRAHVALARRRRLGGDRRRQDEALRLHGLLPGPGARRPLHPDRPLLPLLEGQDERLRAALHRARRAHQREHAPLRGREDHRRAQPPPEERAGLAHPRPRGCVQGRGELPPRVAGAERHEDPDRQGSRAVVQRSLHSRDPRGGALSRLAAARERVSGERRLRRRPDRPSRVRLPQRGRDRTSRRRYPQRLARLRRGEYCPPVGEGWGESEAPDSARVSPGPRRRPRDAVPARARRPAGTARSRLRNPGAAGEGARAAALLPLEGAGSLQALAARHPGDQRCDGARPGVSGGVGGLRGTVGVLLAIALITSGCGGEQGASRHAGRRLVILGFDGVDPRLLSRWMEEGHLPRLRALAERGEFRPLASTNPPQSPVAWTSFATGTGPARHGIFDFVERDPTTYLPDVGTGGVRPPRFLWGLFRTARAEAYSRRQGTPFWDVAASHGVRVAVLRVPYAFPPDRVPGGRMLSGLGVPDLLGTNSTFTYLASDLEPGTRADPGGGRLFPIPLRGDDADVDIPGPPDPRGDSRPALPLHLGFHVDRAAGTVTVRFAGREERVPRGGWSAWYAFRLPVVAPLGLPLVSVAGLCRFHVVSVEPLRIYLSPLNYAPAAPFVPISTPAGYAGELAAALGPYKTVGWSEDTASLNAERVDEAAFLADLHRTMDEVRATTLHELERPDWDLLVSVFTQTDRVAHMFYRLLDPGHPRYDPVLAARYGDAVQRVYERMDAIVGEVVDKLEPDTTMPGSS